MSDNRKFVVAGLAVCDTREQVNELFSRYEIESDEEKLELLNEAMGSPETFMSSPNVPLEDVLYMEISILLNGTWKMNKLYEKAGF